MSSEYYSSYDVAAAERARVAAERERELAEQRRREEERLAKIAEGRERDALASRFSSDNIEWRRTIALGRLATVAGAAHARGDIALIRRCELLRNDKGGISELEKSIEDIERESNATSLRENGDRVRFPEMAQRAGSILSNLPPEVERAFASQVERIRSIVNDPAGINAMQWVDITLKSILQQAPSIVARTRAALEAQRRQLDEFLVRTRAVEALANVGAILGAALSLGEAIEEAIGICDPTAGGRTVEALRPRVEKLERDFAKARDAQATRDFVMNAVAEVLKEFGYTPIVDSAAVKSEGALAFGAFVTPGGGVVETKVALGGKARFDFKAPHDEMSQGELAERCAYWCTDLESARSELAERGVFLHEISRVAPGQKAIAATALPLPREARSCPEDDDEDGQVTILERKQ